MNTVNLVQGDTGPDIKIAISRANGEDLSMIGAAVSLYIRLRRSENILLTKVGFVNSSDNTVTFTFQSGDLDLAPGEYIGEVEVVFSDNQRETIYDLIIINLRQDFA